MRIHSKVIYKGQFFVGEGQVQTYTKERMFTDEDLAKRFVQILKDGLIQQYSDKEVQILVDKEDQIVVLVEAFDDTLRHTIELKQVQSDINSLSTWI